MEDTTFKGKIVVITGGGGILCGEMAKALALRGAKVAILDLRQENANEVASEIVRNGGDAVGIACDVLKIDSLSKARDQVNDHFNASCDILINGAGGNHPKGTTSKTIYEVGDETKEDITSFFDLDASGISFVFDLNFLGTLLPTQVFTKDMIGKEGCSILNISSMNAFTPLTKIPAYSAAKAAVSNFTEWLAVHFAKAGIRVNALAPGFFLTDQNRALLTHSDDSLTERGNTIIDHTPMGRFGKPEDLNGALLWLCSDAAAFVTGVTVPIDGGFNAFSGV